MATLGSGADEGTSLFARPDLAALATEPPAKPILAWSDLAAMGPTISQPPTKRSGLAAMGTKSVLGRADMAALGPARQQHAYEWPSLATMGQTSQRVPPSQTCAVQWQPEQLPAGIFTSGPVWRDVWCVSHGNHLEQHAIF